DPPHLLRHRPRPAHRVHGGPPRAGRAGPLRCRDHPRARRAGRVLSLRVRGGLRDGARREAPRADRPGDRGDRRRRPRLGQVDLLQGPQRTAARVLLLHAQPERQRRADAGPLRDVREAARSGGSAGVGGGAARVPGSRGGFRSAREVAERVALARPRRGRDRGALAGRALAIRRGTVAVSCTREAGSSRLVGRMSRSKETAIWSQARPASAVAVSPVLLPLAPPSLASPPPAPPGGGPPLAALPFSFEPNVGQTDPRVKFLSRGRGVTLFVAPTETVFMTARSAVRMRLARARGDPRGAGGGPPPGRGPPLPRPGSGLVA